MTKRLHGVVWTQGMFLTPQHFQAQTRCLEDSLQYRFAASQFANWGVTTLEIDIDSLPNGIFNLQGCQGILPDGLPFDMPGTDPLPPSRAIEEYFPSKQDSLDVYLALPEESPRGKNVTLGDTSSPGGSDTLRTRYLADAIMVPDETGLADEKTVQVATRNFRILFGSEPLDGFTKLRLAQVIRDSQGTYMLNPQFVAPCLDINSSEFLMNLLRRQIEVLGTKSSSLSGLRRQKSKSVADFTASELADYWLLNTVNSYLPLLDHIGSVRQGHPESLFVALLQLAGALSTFSLEDDPRQLPKYNHDELGACFVALDQRVRSMLEVAQPVNCIPIPLRYTEKHIWVGSIPEDHLFQDSEFFLAISADLPVETLIQEVQRRVKIASSDDIHVLIKNALPGIRLRHSETPPGAIRIQLKNQYFNLAQAGPLWEKIRSSGTLALFVPPEIQKPEMEVLVVLP